MWWKSARLARAGSARAEPVRVWPVVALCGGRLGGWPIMKPRLHNWAKLGPVASCRRVPSGQTVRWCGNGDG